MTSTLCVLGPVAVERAGHPVPIGGPKVRLLLAVLAAQHGRVLSTDRLCDALWGDDPPGSPVTTLQSHLSRLRRSIEPEATVVALAPGYAIELTDATIDADTFEAAAAHADSLDDPAAAAEAFAAALALWRGPAYADYVDHDPITGEALRLDELRLAVTERWMDARLRLPDNPDLVGDLERLVATNPLRERFWSQLMLALHRNGRQAEALRRSHEFQTLLRDDFGLEVSAAARELERRILADDPTLLVPTEPPPSAPRVPTAEPNTLVGRDDDLEQITALIAEARLVTLVGPGGVGKTRLARRLAGTASAFSTPPVTVELAAIDDPEAVIDAVATALDVQRRQHRTLEDTLVEVLHDREQLVVLDNCEHVLEAVCKLLDTLGRHCPSLHLLTTSRQPLGLPGEVVFAVNPLTVGAVDLDTADLVAASPAVQLFVDRAQAARPGFEPTAANIPALAELCRRLDGLPLALELAAARLRSLGPDAILERIDQRFRLLDAGPHRNDQRHRTLGDLVAWSYDLLPDAEQTVFARLSIFAGSFDLRAAEAVCSDDDDTLEAILALVDKSMVQVTDPDEPRYQLLETLREFGRDRLRELGDVDRLADAHLRWYLVLSEQASFGLTGPDEPTWSRRIDYDFDNLRAAHAHAVRRADVDAALRLVAGLREFAFRRIRYEVTVWAATSIELPGAERHPRYPVVMAVVAYGHFVRGDLETSVTIGHGAIRAGDQFGTTTSGLAERTLGNALFYLGFPDEAMDWMATMLTSARDGGSSARLAHALYMKSVAETSVGHAVPGAALAGEAQAAAAANGSPTARAEALYAMGVAVEASEPVRGLELLRESAAAAAEAGNRWIEGFARTEVFWLEARTGDPRQALADAAPVIESWYQGGDWVNQWLSLRHVFGILHQLDDHRSATILHGALTAAGAAYALPFEPADAERLDALVLDLRAELGPGPFADAVREGAAMPDAAVVAFVLRRIAALTADDT